jgi:type II secretory pathway component GspD/PulD (secretin)
MTDTYHKDRHLSLLGALAILAMLVLVSLQPVYGSNIKSPNGNSTPSINSSKRPGTITASTTSHDKKSTTNTIASKAVITCVNSTIKNALIDVLISRPLVNVNGSIRIDPTFVNHTMTDIMGCIKKIENGLA